MSEHRASQLTWARQARLRRRPLHRPGAAAGGPGPARAGGRDRRVKGNVGRLESGASRVDTATLRSSCARGLRLTVVDRDGARSRRSRPTSCATTPTDASPVTSTCGRRRTRPPTGSTRAVASEGACAGSSSAQSRAARRGRAGVPADHPTVSGGRAQDRAGCATGEGWLPRSDRAAEPQPECACFDDCFERACLTECPCQCEPATGNGGAGQRSLRTSGAPRLPLPPRPSRACCAGASRGSR